MISKNKIAVIIPAFNEEKPIESVIRSVATLGYLVIVVDDGSTDHTAEIARRTGVTVLSHLTNRGQGASLRTGTEYALPHGAEIVVHFDADNQHSPADIDRLVKPVISGEVDVALGSRTLFGTSYRGWQRIRLIGSKFVDRLFTGIPLSDVHNGMRALNRRAAQSITISQDRMAHATEIVSEIRRHSLLYIEIPVSVSYSDYSRSHGSNRSFVKSSLAILKDLLIHKVT